MKGVFLLIASIIGFFQISFGQSSVTGTIVDEADQLKLKNATIMLLQAKDSILVDYTRTDVNGKFALKSPAAGDYLIIVSYPKYADITKSIAMDQPSIDLEQIGLTSVAHLIEEVVVKGRAAITIKGDTTEYDASQFKVEKNAKVEDLLKVLPGITVDAAGNITAQGKTVKKVLVDGEEFFGDDPTLVTRNLRSDMVDKVQVFEKKSEQAERTGVDDGQREQTINVQLKDDAKNGMFGKALVGVGTDDYYMGQVMLNKFKGAQKISAFGLFGNNGTTTMNWQDAQKYGNDDISFSHDGTSLVVNDPFSGQGVVGIPKSINSGVNFSDIWNKNKHRFNMSYKYGRIEADGVDETIMSGIINSNTSKRVDTENDQHRINLRLVSDLDSLNNLVVRGNATKKKLWSNNITNSQNFMQDMTPMTSNRSDEFVENNINEFNFNALYTKKFQRKGRSISLNAAVSSSDTKGNDYLYSTLTQHTIGRDSITDQQKDRNQEVRTLSGALTYTEPLWKDFNLTVGYGIEKNSSESLLESYNKGANGIYDQLDQRFSSNYDFNRLSANYKVALGYTTEKLTVNFTNSLNDDRLKQVNNYDNRSLKRDFLTYNPRVNVNYNISKAKGLRVSYEGRNQLPTLNQIQPILNNSDPLNFYEGNENLNPSFSNSINAFYQSFNILANSFKYFGGSASFTKDPISQNITTNNGVNYYRWANVNGKTDINVSVYGGHFFKLIKSLSVDNAPQISVSINNNNNFFNGEANLVKSQTYAFTYELKRETKTGFNFLLRTSPQYRQMTSNLSPDQDNNGFVLGVNGSLEYFITKSFKVYTNYDYSYEAPTDAFNQKIERFLIHPGISKKFLKNESLMLDFTINDVLNQNIGYSRMQSNSIFMQRRYDTIRRYYMLKLSWDFSKMFVK